MDEPKKLTTRQQAREQEELSASRKAQTETGRDFASVEEMLRHDALHTIVPPTVAVRLQQSVQQEGLKPAPWWRRFFGGPKE